MSYGEPWPHQGQCPYCQPAWAQPAPPSPTPECRALGEPAVRVWVTENGFIVKCADRVTVHEQGECDPAGPENSTADMLRAVLEGVGHIGTKHDPFRVRVNVIDQRSGHSEGEAEL